MSAAPNPQTSKLNVSIVAPSPRYVGGQSVQADLLVQLWRHDPDIDVCFIAVDPPLPRALAWAERIPGLRTILREPLYFWRLWRGLKDVDVAHIFSASYWSFLLAPAPAWFFAKLRGCKSLLNYRSGEARDHLQRFRSAAFVLSRVDKIPVSPYFFKVLLKLILCLPLAGRQSAFFVFWLQDAFITLSLYLLIFYWYVHGQEIILAPGVTKDGP